MTLFICLGVAVIIVICIRLSYHKKYHNFWESKYHESQDLYFTEQHNKEKGMNKKLKFKVGDIVRTRQGVSCKIVRVHNDDIGLDDFDYSVSYCDNEEDGWVFMESELTLFNPTTNYKVDEEVKINRLNKKAIITGVFDWGVHVFYDNSYRALTFSSIEKISK